MKYIPLILLCLATVLHAQEVEMTDQETSALLDRLAEARQGMSSQSDFREEKHLALMNKTVVETGTISFLPPAMFRREVPGKSLTICDGKTLWMYYPAFGEAEKYNLGSNKMLRESMAAMTSGLGLQDVAKNYAIKAYRVGDSFRLKLRPKSSALRRSVSLITLDIAPQLFARSLRIESDKGESTVTTFSNERRAKLSPADFTFDPPAGTKVSEPLGN